MDKFVEIIKTFKGLMKNIKKECDDLDNFHNEVNDAQIICNLKNKYKNEMDVFFEELWVNSDYLNSSYENKAEYLREEMDDFFVNDIETMAYIRKRPLGYAGDFVTMNFIYDFNEQKFLGDTLYQRFINHYVCSVKICNSNIARKCIIKNQIKEIIETLDHEPKLLSLGSGPAREITELIQESQLNRPITFYCLDFEEKAIEFVKNKLSGMDYNSEKIKIHFIHENLLHVIKKGETILPQKSLDFIYISGVFDYFSPKVCQRMLLNNLPLIKESSSLKSIFFNISAEEATHRALYEMLGKWEMIYRTSKELLDWEKDIEGYKFKLKPEVSCPGYHFIEIR